MKSFASSSAWRPLVRRHQPRGHCRATVFEIEVACASSRIPVFDDDQHGTATVVYAALINALRVVKKDISEIRVVVLGVGAAGVAIKQTLC